MQAVSFDVDKDLVVVAFPGRGRELPLDVKWDRAGLPADVDMAVRFAAALEALADEAERWVTAGGRRSVVGAGHAFGTGVRFPRILVAFDPPAAAFRLPFEAARRLAADVRRCRHDVFAEVQRRAGVRYVEDHPELRR